MTIIYPKVGEYRITQDPMRQAKHYTHIFSSEGWKKYFWHFATFLKGIILVGRTIYAVQTLHEPKKLAELVATYPIRFMAVCKMSLMYIHREKVAYFYASIANDFWDFHIAGPEIEKQVRFRLTQGNLIAFGQLITAKTVLILLILFPLVDMPEGKRPLPNIIWTPFDTDPSPLHEILYVVFLWNLSLSVHGNAFFDVLYIYTSQHLYVQFILLKELLLKTTEDVLEGSSDLDKFNSEYFQRRVKSRLDICIEHHNKLLKFGKEIESFTTVALMPQLVMSYAALVVNGYNLSVDHTDVAKTATLFGLTVSFFLQLAGYALLASDLKDQSLSVISAIYGTKWYLFRAPMKRALTFMMLNTEKGINITAGGMANVDNEVLVDVCQKAFSAITLLQAMINEDESD